MAKPMTTDEWRAFVLATPARTAALAVKRADGRPFVAPIWVAFDGDDVIFSTNVDAPSNMRHTCGSRRIALSRCLR